MTVKNILIKEYIITSITMIPKKTTEDWVIPVKIESSFEEKSQNIFSHAYINPVNYMFNECTRQTSMENKAIRNKEKYIHFLEDCMQWILTYGNTHFN